MGDWTDERWLAGVRSWVHGQVEERGAHVTGPLEQPHVRPWSTVLRVPTSVGPAWFKASIPVLAHEAAVVEVLAARRPDAVPELLAVDSGRGWMLMADGGVRLREVVAEERSLRRWLDVLPLYGQVQLDLAGAADELVARGAPDRRLDSLPAQFAELVDGARGISEAERARLRAEVPRVAEMCARLAAHGIPETIQHDDFHDGQVFVRDGRYLVFDWGDACVSHPFFTMAVTLEGVLSWGLDDVEGSEDTTPYARAYLGSFAPGASAERLEEALALALRLGWICRALNVQRCARALPPPHREEALDGVGLRLRLFLGGS